MNEKIIVSIIIVNYNSFSLLHNCLESIIHHSQGFEYEIIVVDNNSSDGDVETIINHFKNVILIKNETNEGFAKANNKGAKIAKGKYLLLLNNDTIFIENTIKKVLNFAESLNNELLIGCQLLNIDGTTQTSVHPFPTVWNIIGANLFLYKIFPNSSHVNKNYLMEKTIKEQTNKIEVEALFGAFLFLLKKSFIELGGFDDNFHFYHEDTDFCFRFKNNIGKVIYFKSTAIVHYGGGTSRQYLWFHYKNRSLSLLKYMKKHFSTGSFLLAAFFHYLGLLMRFPINLFIGIVTLNKNMISKAFYLFKCLFVFPT